MRSSPSSPLLHFVPPAEFRRILGLAERDERAAAFADACRLNVLYMVQRAGSGHLGTTFSSLDIVSWLHLEVMRDGDRYFSSKGHDAPGLYAVPRDPGRRRALEAAMDPAFAWTPSEGRPDSLPLFLLVEADTRDAAQSTSCGQEIAADGVFAVAMLADYRDSLEKFGPWFYRRLYWETGVIGQMLYLEAEASGIRGTGIGCFFDDAVHQMLGLADEAWQSLYHFTAGGPVEDRRLRTIAPYAHLTGR